MPALTGASLSGSWAVVLTVLSLQFLLHRENFTLASNKLSHTDSVIGQTHGDALVEPYTAVTREQM